MTEDEIKLRRITACDAELLRGLIGNPKQEICDHSIGNIFMWESVLETEIADDGKFCLAEHHEGKCYFALRASDGDLVERTKRLLAQFGAPLYLCSLTDAEINVLSEHFGAKFCLDYEDGNADYIYDAEPLRNFSGKKYHAQKNHVNAFLRQYENFRFEKYEDGCEEELLEFFSEYEISTADSTSTAEREMLACKRLVPLLTALNLDARILRVDEKIVGFTVTEKIGDTLMVHIEKALPDYRGIYQVLVQAEANAYPEVLYINREEDDANEGLRRSKLSYHPIMQKQKYTACISK